MKGKNENAIYFDNASTTEISKEVLEDFEQNIKHYGNPSAPHSLGQKAKTILEMSRERIANTLNVEHDSIFFSSGATEAIFHTLLSCFMELKVKEVIYSPLEHKALISSLLRLQKTFSIQTHPIRYNTKGELDLNQLDELLKKTKSKSLVCVMSIQNELGNIYPIAEIGSLCQKHQAYYLCDAVQSIGKSIFFPKKVSASFCVGSGHKCHAPKGIGFLYKSPEVKGFLMQSGGGQESGIRGGTDTGLHTAATAKAIEISQNNLNTTLQKVTTLNTTLLSEMRKKSIEFKVLGSEMRTPWILYISLPKNAKSEMIHFKLSMKNIFVSSGSACKSGAVQGQTYENLNVNPQKEIPLRISFSKNNTLKECYTFCETLSKMLI